MTNFPKHRGNLTPPTGTKALRARIIVGSLTSNNCSDPSFSFQLIVSGNPFSCPKTRRFWVLVQTGLISPIDTNWYCLFLFRKFPQLALAKTHYCAMTFKSLLVASLALLLTAGARAEDAGTCPQEEVCAIPCPADNPTPGIGKLQSNTLISRKKIFMAYK